MKIVLDTNVLVAALLSPLGTCARLLDFVLDGAIGIGVDPRILQEYEDVLHRKELALPVAAVRVVLNFLRESAEPIAARPLATTLPDPDDLPLLEVTATAEAILVTGNLRHFPKKACRTVRVIGPAECLELLRRAEGRS